MNSLWILKKLRFNFKCWDIMRHCVEAFYFKPVEKHNENTFLSKYLPLDFLKNVSNHKSSLICMSAFREKKT